ncbi:two-component system, response regulator YesN [Paenibacillus sp. UNCCL117]|uniref:helix-turn-helix domain-containing protein n=1 Tax=unclassified Paenibacillus TaxID=185978 RepID=UPI000881A526|nr:MULTISPECIES: helix-turn-helix domain-containing protein [unclassified Paenibacillus]SDD04427.1 two-component system, response regulator YesN [Paenibacillus sp. cl123]SFW32083.1 two-component system, response regulator YesN [Paenibacillus sp. UNCCL117]
MLQLLIVDDEIHAVEGVRSGVNWDMLGITSVFSAFTVKQAKEVFEGERVDIMLCDIEMPQASGLELAEWVSERYPRTVIIFLTCHADFKYAKQALQLGSIDYMLKPIPFTELEKTIQKAIEKIHKDSETAQFSQYGQFWFQHQPMLIERFWMDLIHQAIPPSAEAVRNAAAERNIPYDEAMTFIPVLLSVQRWHKELTLREEKIMEYALKNAAEELLVGNKRNGQTISLDGGSLLAILPAEGHAEIETLLKSKCERYIEACVQYFYCDLSCYIGSPVHGYGIHGMVNRLRDAEKSNVAYNNKVFLVSSFSLQSSLHEPPSMGLWAVMMKEGEFRKVLQDATAYVERMVQQDGLDARLLQQFYQDFQQLIYVALQNKGIQAHQLFSNNVSLNFSEKATRSVTDLISWMNHAIGRAEEYADTIEQSESVVNRVISYINRHIAEDLSREDIANHVFLNPDYLTRIFKKETGMAISDYLFQERLKLAQELLVKTDMPISAVASHIGYANFSHFSRMFKKHTDMNPNEYRQLYQQTGR